MLLVPLLNVKKCKECDVELSDYRSLYCRKCSKSGKRNPMYGKKSSRNKGGSIGKLGYRFIWIKGKKVYEHRYIMEQALNRKLKKNEIVHHIDENKLNNKIENLALLSPKYHQRLHHKGILGKRKGKYFICERCNNTFYRRNSYVEKQKKEGWKIRHCSNKCRFN